MPMENPAPNFDTYFLQKIGEEKEVAQSAILRGGCSDYAEYKRLVGLLQGLRTAELILQEILTAWNNR